MLTCKGLQHWEKVIKLKAVLFILKRCLRGPNRWRRKSLGHILQLLVFQYYNDINALREGLSHDMQCLMLLENRACINLKICLGKEMVISFGVI